MGRVPVAGISFGGMVAQEFAVTWPGRVERLALLCTSPGGAGGTSYPLHELAGLDEAAGRDRDQLLDTRFTPEWLAGHPSDRGLVEMLAQRNRSAKSADQLRGEREQLGARSRHDVTGSGAIACPTLVASGRYDGIAPPANSEAIAARVPGAELRTYEGRHTFIAQDPAALTDITSFLAAPT